MRPDPSLLWTFQRTINRVPYVLTGAVLFLIKFAIDWTIATQGFGEPWSPLNYLIWPSDREMRVFDLGDERRWFALTMLLVSLPFIWTGVILEGAAEMMIKGYGMGNNWPGYYTLSLQEAFARGWLSRPDDVSETVKLVLLLGEYMHRYYHNRYHAKAQNLRVLLRAAYDKALANYDVLAMPTIPFPATEIGRRSVFRTGDSSRYAVRPCRPPRTIAAEAWLGQGIVLGDTSRHEDAAAALDEALRFKPALAEAWFQRGQLFGKSKRFKEAAEAYSQALTLNPALDYARGYRLHAKMQECDWTNLENETAVLVADVEAGRPAVTPWLLLTMSPSPAMTSVPRSTPCSAIARFHRPRSRAWAATSNGSPATSRLTSAHARFALTQGSAERPSRPSAPRFITCRPA